MMNMEVNICFVYYKNETKEIKVLNMDGAKIQNDDLIKSGWKHSASIDPCKWIEYLHNECEPEDMIAEIIELADMRLNFIVK